MQKTNAIQQRPAATGAPELPNDPVAFKAWLEQGASFANLKTTVTLNISLWPWLWVHLIVAASDSGQSIEEIASAAINDCDAICDWVNEARPVKGGESSGDDDGKPFGLGAEVSTELWEVCAKHGIDPVACVKDWIRGGIDSLDDPDQVQRTRESCPAKGDAHDEA